MILLIDNYDSFTYNLAQYIGTFSPVKVLRNDDPRLYQVAKKAQALVFLRDLVGQLMLEKWRNDSRFCWGKANFGNLLGTSGYLQRLLVETRFGSKGHAW